MTLPRFVASSAALLLLSVAGCGGGGESADSAASASTSKAPAVAQAGAGERAYAQRCVSCHQMNGQGTPGVFPPLVGSEYVVGNAGIPIRVLLHGLQGPITVNGAEYNSLMPAYGIGIVMSDEEVAAVLTYVRSSWGNTASAVTAADVATVREETKGHTGAMTVELLKPLLGK